MIESAKKLRAIYKRTPHTPFFQREFGFFTIDRWKKEGYISDDTDLDKLFGFDQPGNYNLGQLGWTIPPFEPEFENKVIQDRGDHELVQDQAGRYVLFFKGRRSGFMPEYVSHPVKDQKTWEQDVKWRLDPKTSTRSQQFEKVLPELKNAVQDGLIITERVIGGYMYLRSLIGPAELPLFFYDHPNVIHSCMETWFNLADRIIEMHQNYVEIDELFFGEDICYNHGPLISPKMIEEFLLPYYQQLIANIKSRQSKSSRHLYFHIDSDGYVIPVIPIYKKLGMDVMSPFEVASGCDVVREGKIFFDIAMFGGIDKRVLSKSKEEIDKHLDYILPAMFKRGGYIPTCDHGVPEEVSFENYMHYRKKVLEYNR